MSTTTQNETFSLTWKIENIHLSNRRINSYLPSPTFKVGLFQNTTWRLLLAPSGIDDPLFMGCCLERASTVEEPEIVRLQWKIYVIAEGGTVRFEKQISSIFPRWKSEAVTNFILKSDLLPTDLPNKHLTIHFEMKNDPQYSSFEDEKYDSIGLSLDLASLLESGFRSDFKMYCRGEIFNVHKFILLSRWPDIGKALDIDMVTRDDIIMTDIAPSNLYVLLNFIYTGMLHRKNISMELCTYMHENGCENLLESFETPVSSVEFVTYMHHEWKHLTWEVGDENAWEKFDESFFRVMPLEEIYASEMVIIFSFEEIHGVEWLRLDLFVTGVLPDRPILFDGEITFKNKNTVVCSRKVHHLVETNEEWCFPPLVKKDDLFPNERNSKCVEFNLCICDGSVVSRLAATNITNASRFNVVKDFRSLQKDINTTVLTDMRLKLGEHVYVVHSAIMAARSERFKELIQENDKMIEIDSDFTKLAADSLFSHLYGGPLRTNMDLTSKFQLLFASEKYRIESLLDKMNRILFGFKK